MKEGGEQDSYQYELSPETEPHSTKAEGNTYIEVPSPPVSCQSLPAKPLTVATPTGEDMGVARDGKAEVVVQYDSASQEIAHEVKQEFRFS